MSIWIREYKYHIFLYGMGILVLLFGFGAGYITARNMNKTPIVIEKCSEK